MKPSVRQVPVSQVSAVRSESTPKPSLELIPVVFFVLGILLAASVLQGFGA